MTTTIVTPPMRRKAEALALLVPTFHRGRSKETGDAFVIVPSSDPHTAHWTTSFGCTCRGFRMRGVCTHVLAVRIAEERARASAPRRFSKGLAALTGGCERPGCPEDAIGATGRCGAHFLNPPAED